MINPLYLKYILKSHRGFLIFSMIFIAATQFLLINIFTGVDTKPFITSMLDLLPEQFKVLLGEQFFSHLSVEGAVAFGLNHPIILAIIVILVISISSRHIAGEIEKGSMELMLSLPIKRTELLLHLWLISVFVVLALVIFAMIGSILGVVIFDSINSKFIYGISKIGINLWFFIVLIMTFSLMISTFENESSKVVGRSAIVIIVFYFLDFVSKMWKPLEFTQVFNIFTYYQPQKVMFGERTLYDNIPILLILTVICLAVSLWQFRRRDIP